MIGAELVRGILPDLRRLPAASWPEFHDFRLQVSGRYGRKRSSSAIFRRFPVCVQLPSGQLSRGNVMTAAHWQETQVIDSQHLRLTRFVVPTRCSLISPLRERLLSAIGEFQVVSGSRENHFCMALEEALNNAFYHGNLEISSELKEDGTSRFLDLAREREQLEPWKSRHVQVTELVGLFGLWISISDEGNGFNVEAAFERCNDPELMLASGRGLLIMRAFTDELFFSARGNEVTIVLYSDDARKELPLQAVPETGELLRMEAAI